jgi:hypothetical protein
MEVNDFHQTKASCYSSSSTCERTIMVAVAAVDICHLRATLMIRHDDSTHSTIEVCRLLSRSGSEGELPPSSAYPALVW